MESLSLHSCTHVPRPPRSLTCTWHPSQASSWQDPVHIIGNVVFTGGFFLALFGTVGQIWFNKTNREFNKVNLDNVEEYM